MKKIFLIAAVATLSLGSCNRNREAHANDDEDHTGSVGAAGHTNKETDTTGTDGYKADSITQTYPIPR